MRSGLAGICAGVKTTGQGGQTVQGIGMYASWEADAVDWANWQRSTSGASTP